jgi:hypothetical protein
VAKPARTLSTETLQQCPADPVTFAAVILGSEPWPHQQEPALPEPHRRGEGGPPVGQVHRRGDLGTLAAVQQARRQHPDHQRRGGRGQAGAGGGPAPVGRLPRVRGVHQHSQHHALWHLLAHTGMRRGEALALRWRDIDLGTGLLSVIRLHDLRHTHATLLLLAREPVHVVSQRLGHSSPVVIMTIYAHVLPGSQREATNTFARVIAEASARDALKCQSGVAKAPKGNNKALAWENPVSEGRMRQNPNACSLVSSQLGAFRHRGRRPMDHDRLRRTACTHRRNRFLLDPGLYMTHNPRHEW